MDASFLLLPDMPPAAALRRAPFSSRTGPSDEPAMHVRRYGTRQHVFSTGDPATSIHEVAQGTVLVSRYLSDGRRQIVDIIGPGRLFGFASSTHGCTAEVVMPAMICCLDREAASHSPIVAERTLRAMVHEIEHLRDLALLLGRKTASERVATMLAKLAGDNPAHAILLTLPVTRGEIADYLGLTVETVSRTFGRLKQAGLIEVPSNERVNILDLPRLRRLADGLEWEV